MLAGPPLLPLVVLDVLAADPLTLSAAVAATEVVELADTVSAELGASAPPVQSSVTAAIAAATLNFRVLIMFTKITPFMGDSRDILVAQSVYVNCFAVYALRRERKYIYSNDNIVVKLWLHKTQHESDLVRIWEETTLVLRFKQTAHIM